MTTVEQWTTWRRVGGVQVDDLVAAWGAPLTVVDEDGFLTDLQRICETRSVRPVLAAGPLAGLTGDWAQRYGWDVWGDPEALEDPGVGWCGPRRRILDLRGRRPGADVGPLPTRLVVDAVMLGHPLLRRGDVRAAYVALDGLDLTPGGRTVRRLASASASPQLAGFCVRLGAAESAPELVARVLDARRLLSHHLPASPGLLVDCGSHPHPEPALRALAQLDRGVAGLDAPGVLADATHSLLQRWSLTVTQKLPDGSSVLSPGGLAPHGRWVVVGRDGRARPGVTAVGLPAARTGRD